MKKYKKYNWSFITLISVTLITSVLAISNIIASVPYQLDTNTNTIMKKFDSLMSSIPTDWSS